MLNKHTDAYIELAEKEVIAMLQAEGVGIDAIKAMISKVTGPDTGYYEQQIRTHQEHSLQPHVNLTCTATATLSIALGFDRKTNFFWLLCVPRGI